MVFFSSPKNKSSEKHIAGGICVVLYIFIASFFLQKDQVYAQAPITNPVDLFAGIKSVAEIQQRYSRLFDPNSPQYRMLKDLQLRAIDNAQSGGEPENTPITLDDYIQSVDASTLQRVVRDPTLRGPYIDAIQKAFFETISVGYPSSDDNLRQEALRRATQILESGLGTNVLYEQIPVEDDPNDVYKSAGYNGPFYTYAESQSARDSKYTYTYWGEYIRFNTDYYDTDKRISFSTFGHEATHIFDYYHWSTDTEPIIKAAILSGLDSDTYQAKVRKLVLSSKIEYNANIFQKDLAQLYSAYDLEALNKINFYQQRANKFYNSYSNNLNAVENIMFNLPSGSKSYIDLANSPSDKTLLTSAGTEISFPEKGTVVMRTADGVETVRYKEGAKQTTYSGGTKVVEYPSGIITVESPGGVITVISAESLARDKQAIEEEEALALEKQEEEAYSAQQRAKAALQTGSAARTSESEGGVSSNPVSGKTNPEGGKPVSGTVTDIVKKAEADVKARTISQKDYATILKETGTYKVGNKTYQDANPKMIPDPNNPGQLKPNPDYVNPNEGGPRMVKDPADETKEIVKPGVDINKDFPECAGSVCSIDRDGVLINDKGEVLTVL